MLSFLIILGTALVLGLRHGIDWDHIAAITDITGSTDQRKKSFFDATMYVLGHAFVILALGLLAILAGTFLPKWIDGFMEHIVGVTLIILGVWLISAVIIHGRHYKMQSRWMLMFKIFVKIYNFIHRKLAHKHELPHIHYPETFTPTTAFVVGMIHGVGAETPTQVVLFSTAAGVTGRLSGIIILLVFVLGLVISNSFIAILALFGHTGVNKKPVVHLGLGIIAGIFSIIVGLTFLLGRSGALPAILGG